MKVIFIDPIVELYLYIIKDRLCQILSKLNNNKKVIKLSIF